MNTYSFTPLIISLLLFSLGIFVFLKNRANSLNRVFFYLSTVSSIWLFFYSLAYNTSVEEQALTLLKIGYCGVVFIAITYFHYAVAFLRMKKMRPVIFVSYFIGIGWILTIFFTPYFISGVYKYFWGYYPKAGMLHPVFLVFFIGLLSFSMILYSYFLFFKKALSVIEKIQVKYIFLAFAIYNLACIDFVPNYGITIYPFGCIPTFFFLLIFSFTIVKYRLMDIRIFITRATIFLFVYTLVLGLPLWFAIVTQRWLWAMLMMSILASIGPFIYSYLRQQIENVILQKEKSYQHSIREIAARILQKRDLATLWSAIISEVKEAVQPEFICLYAFSKADKNYVLNQNNVSHGGFQIDKQIPWDSVLVKGLCEYKKPILVESVLLSNFPLETVAIPFFVEGSLFAFMLLGPKPKKALYTEADFTAFDILSSQTSLAIENCLFWQDEKTRLAREEQIRRQKAMDHFSASMAHEIDNPVFAISGIAEMTKERIETDFKNSLPPEALNFLNDRLTRITKDLLRISKMIKAIREFSGQTKGEFTLLNMDDVLETCLEIMAPQFKYEGIIFTKEITPGLMVEGNKIHLEEVFVNIASNAMHAIKHNQKKEKELSLKVHKNTPKTLAIEFKDNGYGIKREMLEDIFLDFVTTKASSEGTGMGLGRVRKIVENHGGKIWAQSEGEGKGAEFFIELPLA